jgi:hypothetical protein
VSKIDKFITAEQIAKQARVGRMDLTFEIDKSSSSFSLPSHEVVYRVGFKFEMRMAGPEGPEPLRVMLETAARQMNREVYGGINDGLHDLYALLYEEMYRQPDSPVIQKLHELLEACK